MPDYIACPYWRIQEVYLITGSSVEHCCTHQLNPFKTCPYNINNSNCVFLQLESLLHLISKTEEDI